MPRARRRREIAAPAEKVWEVVAEPHHLPRWWPGVERVEDASPEAWTEVFRSRRGRPVRADFTLVAAEPPRLVRWRQEVEATPFERFLAESVTEVRVEPVGDGERARVEISLTQRLRGLMRLAWAIFRAQAGRQLDDALEGLDTILGR